MDQLNVRAWEGRTDLQEGVISPAQAAQIHATLGSSRHAAPTMGEAMDPLWHWCAFTPTNPMGELARDGHPILGDFLPPVRLERRMWASGSLSFGAPLRVGERLTKRSFIRSVTEKEGGSGPMVLVSVDHKIYGEQGLAIEERQHIVYLDIPDSFRPPRPRALPDNPVLRDRRQVSEPLLFRYSAITFNAHRIHYDLPYAQEVEHYPGLVVHGPLQATWLMQAACAHKGRRPKHFDFRGVHPVFLTPGESREIEVMGQEDEMGGLILCTGQGGHQGMQATAMWEETQ